MDAIPPMIAIAVKIPPTVPFASNDPLKSVLQVGTGDSPLTVPFYEKCGFVRSHTVQGFFTANYSHPIFEGGVQLVDMVYLRKPL